METYGSVIVIYYILTVHNTVDTMYESLKYTALQLVYKNSTYFTLSTAINNQLIYFAAVGIGGYYEDSKSVVY